MLSYGQVVLYPSGNDKNRRYVRPYFSALPTLHSSFNVVDDFSLETPSLENDLTNLPS